MTRSPPDQHHADQVGEPVVHLGPSPSGVPRRRITPSVTRNQPSAKQQRAADAEADGLAQVLERADGLLLGVRP